MKPCTLGFQPWPYAISQAAVDWTWDQITRDGDFYSIHIEEGVPWPELLADAPFPAAFEASLAAKQAAMAPGHAVLLSLNALDIEKHCLSHDWVRNGCLVDVGTDSRRGGSLEGIEVYTAQRKHRRPEHRD